MDVNSETHINNSTLLPSVHDLDNYVIPSQTNYYNFGAKMK